MKALKNGSGVLPKKGKDVGRGDFSDKEMKKGTFSAYDKTRHAQDSKGGGK